MESQSGFGYCRRGGVLGSPAWSSVCLRLRLGWAKWTPVGWGHWGRKTGVEDWVLTGARLGEFGLTGSDRASERASVGGQGRGSGEGELSRN